MAHLTRRDVLHAAGIAGMIVSSRRPAQAGATAARLLRVGFQKGEPILLAAKQNRSLETLLNPLDIEVQWIEFQFGPPMLEAMRVNSVDIGAVGDTPPVFAQAAHGDLLYIAAQRAGGQAILVPPGSTLQTLHDLKGRKVAFGRASSAHNLTLAALEKAGLTYNDIQPIYLGPADAGAAFERGAIDAWTIWDPYYALFETRPGVRMLAKWTDITEQNSFFMCRRAYVEANEQVTTKIIAEFGRIAEWARSHRPELARPARERDRHAARRRTARRGSGAVPGAADERRTRPRPAEGRRPFSRPRPDPDGDQGKRADLARRRMNRLLPWLMPIAVLLLWQVGSNLHVIEANVLPAPIAVAQAGWRLARSGELWTNIEISACRALAGFAIGGGIGFALGMLNGLSSLSETLTDSTLQMIRNIPHLALIPLVILWFGIDEEAKMFLVALGVFFPIYVNTLHGVRSVDPHLLEMAPRLWHAPPALFRRVVLPGALPSIFVGLRYGARHHVADADRRRDDRRLLRHRLHGDERPRVHAGRRRGVRHPALRAAGQARGQRWRGCWSAPRSPGTPPTQRPDAMTVDGSRPRRRSELPRSELHRRRGHAARAWQSRSARIRCCAASISTSPPGSSSPSSAAAAAARSTLVAADRRAGRAEQRRIASMVGPTAGSDAVRLMFQEPRLLPWERVAGNVEVGLAHARGRRERERAGGGRAGAGRPGRPRDTTGPRVLSGGQKQRVALARALVSHPRLLALDEPLGALDALTRIEMQELIERVWQAKGFTAIVVTHDVAEAVALADRILLLEDGVVAMDVPVDLPRPRRRGDARAAEIEGRILDRLLRRGLTPIGAVLHAADVPKIRARGLDQSGQVLAIRGADLELTQRDVWHHLERPRLKRIGGRVALRARSARAARSAIFPRSSRRRTSRTSLKRRGHAQRTAAPGRR